MVGLRFSADVLQLLSTAPLGSLAITDFALHSIGVRIARARPDQFRDFLDDLVTLRVNTLHLPASSLYAVMEAMHTYSLDFDDGLQYVSADRHDLKIVSFDTDFDRTSRQRMTPAQVLKSGIPELASIWLQAFWQRCSNAKRVGEGSALRVPCRTPC